MPSIILLKSDVSMSVLVLIQRRLMGPMGCLLLFLITVLLWWHPAMSYSSRFSKSGPQSSNSWPVTLLDIYITIWPATAYPNKWVSRRLSTWSERVERGKFTWLRSLPQKHHRKSPGKKWLHGNKRSCREAPTWDWPLSWHLATLHYSDVPWAVFPHQSW